MTENSASTSGSFMMICSACRAMFARVFERRAGRRLDLQR